MTHEAQTIADRFFAACENLNAAIAEMEAAKIEVKVQVERQGKGITSETLELRRIIPQPAQKIVQFDPAEWKSRQAEQAVVKDTTDIGDEIPIVGDKEKG